MLHSCKLLRRCALLAGAALSLTALPGSAFAQAYPTKPIRLIVPFPGGASSLDMLIRLVTPPVSEALGQPLIVDYRASANGMIGSALVAKSAPDGYTILSGTSSTHLSAVNLSKTVPYDPIKDFSPIIPLVDPTTVLVVHPSLPVGSVKELVDHARRNPGKLSYASWGAGGFAHLSIEIFKQAANVDIVHIPYKGAAAATLDLVAGRVEVGIVSRATGTQHAANGRLRELALMDRYAGLPANAIVLAEALPGFEKLYSFYGIFGPAAMPRPIVNRLHGEFARAVARPEVRQKLDELNLAVLSTTPEEFSAILRKGLSTYGEAIKRAGVQPE